MSLTVEELFEGVPTLTSEELERYLPMDWLTNQNFAVHDEHPGEVQNEGAASATSFVNNWTEDNPCKVKVISDVLVKKAEAAVMTTTTVEPQPSGSKLRRLLASSQSTISKLSRGKQLPSPPPPQPPSQSTPSPQPSPQASMSEETGRDNDDIAEAERATTPPPRPAETEKPSSPILSGKRRRLGGKRRRRDSSSHASDEGQQQQNPAWFDDFTSSQKSVLVKVLNVRDSTARDLELAESDVDARKKHIVELEKQLDAAREQLLDVENNCILFRNRLKHLDNFK